MPDHEFPSNKSHAANARPIPTSTNGLLAEIEQHLSLIENQLEMNNCTNSELVPSTKIGNILTTCTDILTRLQGINKELSKLTEL